MAAERTKRPFLLKFAGSLHWSSIPVNSDCPKWYASAHPFATRLGLAGGSRIQRAIAFQADLRSQAEALGHPGAPALHQGVGAGHEVKNQCHPVGVLQVDGHRPAAAL